MSKLYLSLFFIALSAVIFLAMPSMDFSHLSVRAVDQQCQDDDSQGIVSCNQGEIKLACTTSSRRPGHECGTCIAFNRSPGSSSGSCGLCINTDYVGVTGTLYCDPQNIDPIKNTDSNNECKSYYHRGPYISASHACGSCLDGYQEPPSDSNHPLVCITKTSSIPNQNSNSNTNNNHICMGGNNVPIPCANGTCVNAVAPDQGQVCEQAIPGGGVSGAQCTNTTPGCQKGFTCIKNTDKAYTTPIGQCVAAGYEPVGGDCIDFGTNQPVDSVCGAPTGTQPNCSSSDDSKQPGSKFPYGTCSTGATIGSGTPGGNSTPGTPPGGSAGSGSGAGNSSTGGAGSSGSAGSTNPPAGNGSNSSGTSPACGQNGQACCTSSTPCTDPADVCDGTQNLCLVKQNTSCTDGSKCANGNQCTAPNAFGQAACCPVGDTWGVDPNNTAQGACLPAGTVQKNSTAPPAPGRSAGNNGPQVPEPTLIDQCKNVDCTKVTVDSCTSNPCCYFEQ